MEPIDPPSPRDARTRKSTVPANAQLIDSAWRRAQEILQTELEVRELASGVSSLNFLLVAGSNQFVLRLDLYRSMENVAFDADLAALCSNAGVSVPPRPLWTGTVRGVPTTIRSFLPGRTMLDPNYATETAYEDAGRQLAIIHGIVATVTRPWFYDAPIRDLKTLELPDSPLVEAARSLAMHLAYEMPSTVWARGLVHTDYRPSNWLVTDSGVTVLDWEKAAIGPVLFDVGLAAFHLATADDDNLWPDYLLAFLRGYESLAPNHLFGRRSLADMLAFAASIYYIVDAEIWIKETQKEVMEMLDSRHAEYFTTYCTPRYERLHIRLSRITDLLAERFGCPE